MKTSKFIIYTVLFGINFLKGNISLPNIFSDNMVFQRNSEVKVWGWANPKEEIKIFPSWNNIEYKVTADRNANWSIFLQIPKEGGPYTIQLKGYNEVLLKNILIGEVWLCSGQSNMEMTPNWGVLDGEKESENAVNSNIRFFRVEKRSASTPQNNIFGNWQECSPETMKNNSALAYFFANRLTEDLKNIPIGLIVSAWGGTTAEVWMPESIFKNDKELLETAKNNKENEYCPTEPSQVFNAMIHPLIPYRIAGILWYQGESNVGSNIYKKTFSSLINSWRELWKMNLPFYYVQIAPFALENDNFSNVQTRNFQRQTLEMSNTSMVVISDISELNDLHPKDKKTVGIRLANLALANIYKVNSNIVNGPLYKYFKVKKNQVTVFFDYSDGLHFKSKIMNQFEICGDDNIFYQANAKIVNNTVILTSNKVKRPVKVRFAWGNSIQSQLFNKENLPASSFTTE